MGREEGKVEGDMGMHIYQYTLVNGEGKKVVVREEKKMEKLLKMIKKVTKQP